MKHVPNIVTFNFLILTNLLVTNQYQVKEIKALHQSQPVINSSEESLRLASSASFKPYDESKIGDSVNSFVEDSKNNFREGMQMNVTVQSDNSMDLEVKANTTHKGSDNETKLSSGTLEEFVNENLGSPEASNTLPMFLTEPENGFVVKNRPAILKCKAAHALQLHFKCSGSSQPPPSTHDKHVDPRTGTHLEEVTATIHRDLIDEYFGKGPFKCECLAWSSRGEVKSRSANVNIAYLRKQFVTSPTSLRVEIGSSAELKCEAPSGFPEPKITWLKNNVPITDPQDGQTELVSDGTLKFRQISLLDMANYTCSAENIAGKRISESAVLIVYVNGGWTPWSSWKDCKCMGKANQGRKRMRTCTNPVPLNGGSQCSGPQVQKSSDCLTCAEDTQIVATDNLDFSKRHGRWSTWSDWTPCSDDCIQVRRRKCLSQHLEDIYAIEPGYLKLQCTGKEIQTAECRGDQCRFKKEDFDWTLYVGLAFITATFFAFGTTLICCAKRGISTNSHYNMSRTGMDAEYIQGVDKKEMRMHMEAVNAGYDYVNPSHSYLANENMVTCSITEHHYDVPNLTANYAMPIDDLSANYLSDTGESSNGDSSKSSCEMPIKLKMPELNQCSAHEYLSCSGGSVRLYGSEFMLSIPDMAITKPSKKHITLMILNDESTRSSLNSSESLLACSCIVYCAPRNYNFHKPLILKIPHCLNNPADWNVNVYHSDQDYEELNIYWRKIITIGEETINTPVYVHVESSHVYIMTEQLGRFIVVADPKVPVCDIQSSIRMKLFAFSQMTPSNLNNILRVYIVKDFPNSKDTCSNIEAKLGGTYVGESETFGFHLNNSDLNIRVVSNSCDWEKSHYEQVIPYNHILGSNSILHCEFSLKNSGQLHAHSLVVEFTQLNDCSEEYSFSVPSLNCAKTDLTISIDRQGNFVNNTLNNSSQQLPSATKRLLMEALDPPRADEKDWRLLAKMLNTDRYIAYFATKTSPTEQILNLWECRCPKTSNTIVELLLAFKKMERQDVMDIIVDTMGPMWI